MRELGGSSLLKAPLGAESRWSLDWACCLGITKRADRGASGGEWDSGRSVVTLSRFHQGLGSSPLPWLLLAEPPWGSLYRTSRAAESLGARGTGPSDGVGPLKMSPEQKHLTLKHRGCEAEP